MVFAGIRGQQHILPRLSRALARGSVPPSLLFVGPEGVGKFRTALAVAQALNCAVPIRTPAFEIDACGTCAECRRIASGAHPDILIVRAPALLRADEYARFPSLERKDYDSAHILIEQTRAVVDATSYRPFAGRRRVVIVDEAERMLDPAVSALLKTLEEPPATSVIILVTAHPDALPATVRSRCPSVRFAPLAFDEIVRALVEDHGVPLAQAQEAAGVAEGSLGRALQARTDEAIRVRERAKEAIEMAAEDRSGPGDLLQLAKPLAPDREGAEDHLIALGTLLRDAQVIASGAEPSCLANRDRADSLEAIARRFGGPAGVAAFETVARALEAVRRNAHRQVAMEWALLHLDAEGPRL